MTTIRIAEDALPKGIPHLSKSEPLGSEPSIQTSRDDGIYNIRSRTRVALRDSSDDEDPGLRKEGDFKQKQVWSNSAACSRRVV
jgi:hypothetical protein